MSGKSSRIKGHSYERYVVNIFKKLGFTNCSTSRYTNRRLDDQKVDIDGLENFNVQCKAVEKLGGLHDILKSMPPDDKINMVFHKRNCKGTIVAMELDDFIKLVKLTNFIND